MVESKQLRNRLQRSLMNGASLHFSGCFDKEILSIFSCNLKEMFIDLFGL